MPSVRNRTTRLIAGLLVAWVALVACRVGARLISVGAGTRSVLELTLLTASVNAYWLAAGPLLAWWRRRFSTTRDALSSAALIAVACVAVVAVEPLWYRVVLTAFHGRPLEWPAAVVSRGDVNVLIVVLVVAAGAMWDARVRATARQRQRDELESVLVDAELRALALQLQPHFLFNTLQLAAEAAFDDIEVAKGIVHDLQTLLRRTFVFEEQSLVRVADEVDFLQSYVAIQRRRFGSRLRVEVHVDPAANDLMIPPLLLQPLVENSIQHGLAPLARDGLVVVRLSVDEAWLRIEVRDNGIGFAAGARSSPSSGLGLGVTERRLRALFPQRHRFETTVAPEGGAAVTVHVPASRAAAPGPPVGGDIAASRAPAAERPTTQRWPVLGLVTLGAIAALVAINVAIGEMLLRQSAPAATPRPVLIPGSAAMWIPAQLLALALAVVLWRAHAVRAWLRLRDAEALTLRSQVDGARARIEALRVGKNLMLTTLGRLAVARDPVEFDQMVIGSSELIRSLLVLADGAQSSVELEAELVRRYFAVLRPHDAGEAADQTELAISVEASHARLPSGSLPAVLNSLLSTAGDSARGLRVEADVATGWLSIHFHLLCSRGGNGEELDRISAEVRHIEARMRQGWTPECELAVGATSDGYRASVRLPYTAGLPVPALTVI